MSQYMQNKALRLVAEGRVQPIASVRIAASISADRDLQPQLFRVDGDSDSYVTVVAKHVHMCSCKRWRETMLDCSHIKAALLRVYARPDELALMDEALKAVDRSSRRLSQARPLVTKSEGERRAT